VGIKLIYQRLKELMAILFALNVALSFYLEYKEEKKVGE
jgi:hypothetical protein